MTREEAIKQLKELIEHLKNDMYADDKKALEMAIQALSQEPMQMQKITDRIEYGTDGNAYKMWVSNGKEFEQEPCEDAISRQAALDVVCGNYEKDGWGESNFYKAIEKLPSVTQKPETVTEFADRCRECGARYGKLLKQKSGKWIPVSERLPEEGQEILFSTKTGRVHSGKYHDDDSANQWYSHKDKCRAWNNVVNAWMPLPTPFEPQESEE